MKMRIWAIAVCMGLAGLATGQEKTDYKKLFTEYAEKFGPPGPEHKHLQPLAGNFRANVKMWMDPNQSPTTSEGTLMRKAVLGGRFVQEEFEGKFMGGPFQGKGTMGYDRAKKKWVSTWIDSMSTALHCATGAFDDSSKTWTFKHDETCPITGKLVKTRDTLRIVSEDEQRMEMFRQMGDDKEMKVMEITFTRTK